MPKRIEKYLNKAFSTPYNKPAIYEFRSSNLPLCGRALAISNFLQSTDEIPDQEISHQLQCIFNIGSSIHGVTQLWLGMAGLLLGHWVCMGKPNEESIEQAKELAKDKGIGRTLAKEWLKAPYCGWVSENDYMPGSKHAKHARCKKCGNSNPTLWKYEELTLSEPEMSSHTDGYLPRFKAILEIKSTSKKRLQDKKEPDLKHWMYQASAYAAKLEAQYGYKVKRSIILYFERDSLTFKIFVRPIIKNVMPTTRVVHEDAKRKIKLNVLPERICSDMNMGLNFMNCHYARLCFSSQIEKRLNVAQCSGRS